MSFTCLRFTRAFGRAQALPAVLAGWSAVVALGVLASGSDVALPGFTHQLPAERFVPALLASVGALLVAVDWGEHERFSARSVHLLRAVRFLVGAAAAYGGGASIGGGTVVDADLVVVRLPELAVGLFVALVLLLVIWQRGWWLALPVLLYAQCFLDQLPWLHVGGLPLLLATAVVGVLYVLRGPGGGRGADLLPG